MPDPLLVVVAGPTASGKTELSIAVAKHYQTVVVSADSRQFYKEIPIGTAQPDDAEKEAVPHYFIGDLSVEESLSAGEYASRCRKLLHQLFALHDTVVLTGGSGLYLDAVLYGVDTFPETDPTIRAALNRDYHENGITALQEELKAKDPVHYSRIDLQNPRRLIRALEVCRAAGQPYSAFLGKDATPLPWNYLLVGIQWPREELYQRINHRVDRMISAGLETEALAVHHKKHLNALHTVGYSEFFEFFEGRISREVAIERIKQNSRNYAKRQLTWCRRHQEMVWLMPGDPMSVIDCIEAKRTRH